MKKFLLTLPMLFLAVSCQYAKPPNVKPAPVACTQEAKICPDGSSVGRTGPNCAFAECPKTQPPVVCPQIAKPCPDGSYVSPQGPNCEIPACAAVKLPQGSSGISGKITLGPTCPVMRQPPDPACDDKPYQATVIVKTQNGQQEITRFTSQTDGTFSLSLNPGTYLLVPQSANVYPRGIAQVVTVEKNKFTTIIISYDTGIR